MLEGLAIWALFIYLLRLVGMPWNVYSKGFAYIGGTAWLLFVWVGLINYTPMDLSGGSVVQSPHIQLRPDSTNVKGKVDAIYIEPNQELEKGQPIYQLDSTAYEIALNKAKVQLSSAQTQLENAEQDVVIATATYETSKQDIHTAESQVDSAKADLALQVKTLNRFEEQNRVVEHTITENDIDKQRTAVQLAKQNLETLESQLATKKLNSEKAHMAIASARLKVDAMQANIETAEENVKQAEWDLQSTTVYAPTDGFVTNFILREGQRVSAMPRLQMYTNEKYVLMRVNHQAIRNVKPGQAAEFASAVYPGKVFAAQVEGIVEATGEAQGTLLGFDESVRVTTGKNLQNKHHFVRLKIEEPEGYDIPVGSVGLAWVSGEKPIGFMSFLDAIRGIILRMKSQLYYFYSI
ncbi:efflux RND transporter periplasmic adaptor subunit [Vibrio hannami]|uniref:HlyD family secretion protein n=1 Tax=Vibrio hannami TaxID=2717094 RepID=UPI002410868E|nr:efflux RND transporter periplasmic adaptor subunit [Vibrio hannami]MDG3085927.1 efflux RND transporter periplasmic adaptor subunit [Vibrio hannami]